MSFTLSTSIDQIIINETNFTNISKVEKTFQESLDITDKPIENIINSQLDIKLGQFMEEKFDAVVKIIKS